MKTTNNQKSSYGSNQIEDKVKKGSKKEDTSPVSLLPSNTAKRDDTLELKVGRSLRDNHGIINTTMFAASSSGPISAAITEPIAQQSSGQAGSSATAPGGMTFSSLQSHTAAQVLVSPKPLINAELLEKLAAVAKEGNGSAFLRSPSEASPMSSPASIAPPPSTPSHSATSSIVAVNSSHAALVTVSIASPLPYRYNYSPSLLFLSQQKSPFIATEASVEAAQHPMTQQNSTAAPAVVNTTLHGGTKSQ